MMPKERLRLEHLGKAYGSAVIVKDVSVRLYEGDCVALIGHSGCGKSTVLSMIAGLTPVTSGRIVIDGHEVHGPGPDRGVVFQAPCLLPWMNALDNVLLGLDVAMPTASEAERRARGERALVEVGLGDAFRVKPASLSQGMRQRVALARALARQPATLLLDEPFGMLDSITRAELQDLLLATRSEHGTTLLVTHDIDEALLLSDRIVVMTDGPAAGIRAILDVPFGRRRLRERVLAHPAYEGLRDEVHGLLEGHVGPTEEATRAA